MKPPLLLCCTVLALLLSPFAASGQLQDIPKQFSADLTLSGKADANSVIHLYVDGDKRRIDMTHQSHSMTILLRGDQKKSYMLMPQMKAYQELPFDPQALHEFDDPAEQAKALGGKFEKVGTEKVNGEPCDKYRWEYRMGDLGKLPDASAKGGTDNSSMVSGVTWFSQTNHLPIRSETAKFTTEMKNIRLGAPDPAQFEVPADYQNLSSKKMAAPPH